jgi:hypothetical protein
MKQNEEEKDDSIIEDLDFNNPSFVYKPEANHGWRQQGPYLICKDCIVEHGAWIGTDKLLIGFDEQGSPQFKTRKELGME